MTTHKWITVKSRNDPIESPDTPRVPHSRLVMGLAYRLTHSQEDDDRFDTWSADTVTMPTTLLRHADEHLQSPQTVSAVTPAWSIPEALSCRLSLSDMTHL